MRVQFWVVVDNSLRSMDGGGEPLCEEVEWWLRLQLTGAVTKDHLLGPEKKSDGMRERGCLVHNRGPHFCVVTLLWPILCSPLSLVRKIT